MQRRARRILAAWTCMASAVAAVAAVGCQSSETTPIPDDSGAAADTGSPVDAGDSSSCAAPHAAACIISDARADGPCPLNECIAAAARAAIAGEAKIAELAQSRATAPAVKAIADQMVSELSADDAPDPSGPGLAAAEGRQGIKEIACDTSNAIAAQLDASYAALASLSGAAFDKQFVCSQRADLSSVKHLYNYTLNPCASISDFKVSIRYERGRSLDGGGAGFVPDLKSLLAVPMDCGTTDAGGVR